MSKHIDTINLKGGDGGNIELNFQNLRKSVLILRAANHDLRRKIIELLQENEKLTVTKIYVALRVEQSVASQHLATLRRVGIVDTTREGKYIHYFLNNERLNKIGEFVDAIAELN